MYHDIGIMQVPNYLHHSKKAQKPTKKPAPAVKAMKAKSKGLVPAKKAAKTSPAKKAARVVGISADENIFLKQLLLYIANDSNYNQDAAF